MLQDDGSTACGNWIYSGCWTELGNMTKRRSQYDPSGLGVYPEWGFAWPANRRVLYNRASADTSGQPWDPERTYLAWRGTWAGDRKSTRLNSSHVAISYAVFCLKKKKII